MSEKQKLLRCGCGGEAKVDWTVINGAYMAGVVCQKCGTKTTSFYDRYSKEKVITEAVEAWNKAMGTDTRRLLEVLVHDATDSNVGNKERTAKVKRCSFGETLTYDFDGQCECGKWVDSLWDYCPSCGAKLDWNEDIPMEYFESGGK